MRFRKLASLTHMHHPAGWSSGRRRRMRTLAPARRAGSSSQRRRPSSSSSVRACSLRHRARDSSMPVVRVSDALGAAWGEDAMEELCNIGIQALSQHGVSRCRSMLLRRRRGQRLRAPCGRLPAAAPPAAPDRGRLPRQEHAAGASRASPGPHMDSAACATRLLSSCQRP